MQMNFSDKKPIINYASHKAKNGNQPAIQKHQVMKQTQTNGHTDTETKSQSLLFDIGIQPLIDNERYYEINLRES